MPTLNMNGPFALKTDVIDKEVNRKTHANYALGYNDQSDGKLVVCYVGRSDTDVNDRLKKWIGKTTHALFKYSYAASPKEAFEKECNNYHDFTPKENTIHPDRPENSGWKCPRCNVFDEKRK